MEKQNLEKQMESNSGSSTKKPLSKLQKTVIGITATGITAGALALGAYGYSMYKLSQIYTEAVPSLFTQLVSDK